MRIIVIPDSHAKPLWTSDFNEDGCKEKKLIPMHIANRRYDWLAQLIIKEIREYEGDNIHIVDLGDFCDLKSLSSYDKGKRPAENERIQLDIDYCRDARFRLTKPLIDLYEADPKLPKLHLTALLGNHENRWKRLRNDEPLWDCFDGLPDDISGAGEMGWKMHAFLDIVEIEGVHFSHYLPNAKNEKMALATGAYPARKQFLGFHQSIVTGHSHDFSLFQPKVHNKEFISLSAGCYFEHKETYTKGITWWAGITILDNVKDGHATVRQIPFEGIKKKYYNKKQGPYDLADIQEVV